MKGLIFSIKRYSVHDGPGIRVTFFMKGCPLACRWCHNPEGISPEPEKLMRSDRVGDREFFQEDLAGKYYSSEELLAIAEKDSVFMRQSGGGVTFSGGEPLMQAPFLAEALGRFKEREFHTAVDTSGYSTADDLRSIIPVTDLFLFDIKHLDDIEHVKHTSISNAIILDNFRIILESGRDVMIRIPVVPGINDDPGYLSELRRFITEARRENVKKINLLPFHAIGVSKYKRFNRQYKMNGTLQPSRNQMNELREFFEETGIPVKIGG